VFRRPDSQRSGQPIQVIRFVGLLDFIGLLLRPVADVDTAAHNRKNHQQNKNQEADQDLYQDTTALC
jgi:hypothetical protein